MECAALLGQEGAWRHPKQGRRKGPQQGVIDRKRGARGGLSADRLYVPVGNARKNVGGNAQVI